LHRWDEPKGVEHYDLIVHPKEKLGVFFQSHNGLLRVQEMDPKGKAQRSGRVRTGDTLVAINFRGIEGLDLSDVGDLLQQSAPPNLFRFRRAPAAATDHNHGAKQSARQAPQKQQQRRPAGSVFKVVVPDLRRLGLQLVDDLSVQAIEPNSALEEKVKENDILVAINGESVKGADLEKAIPILRAARPPLVLEFFTKRMQAASDDVDVPQTAGGFASDAEPGDGHVAGGEGELVLASPPILAGSRYPIRFAKFGTAPSCAIQNFTLFDGALGMACKPVPGALPLNNTVAFVLRGECTFVTKSRTVQEAGGKGMVVITRDFEPISAMPSGAGELRAGPVPFAAAMMGWAEGSSLAILLRNSPLQGALGGPSCDASALVRVQDDSGNHDGGEADYSVEYKRGGRTQQRFAVTGSGELLFWSSATQETLSIYALLADFGPEYANVPELMGADPLIPRLAPAPHDACEPLTGSGVDFRGAIVLAYRGKCQYGDKVLHAQNAGARGVIVINTDPQIRKLHRMPAPPNLAGLAKIPSALVTAKDGAILHNLIEPPQDDATIAHDPLVRRAQPPLLIAKLYRKAFYYCNRAKGTICGVDEFPATRPPP